MCGLCRCPYFQVSTLTGFTKIILLCILPLKCNKCIYVNIILLYIFSAYICSYIQKRIHVNLTKLRKLLICVYPFFLHIYTYVCAHSNWESLEAYWEQPQLVHDILDDSDHECFDDEDDENG